MGMQRKKGRLWRLRAAPVRDMRTYRGPVSVAQAAHFLKRSEAQVREYVRKGLLTGTRPGGRLISLNPEELCAFTGLKYDGGTPTGPASLQRIA